MHSVARLMLTAFLGLLLASEKGVVLQPTSTLLLLMILLAIVALCAYAVFRSNLFICFFSPFFPPRLVSVRQITSKGTAGYFIFSTLYLCYFGLLFLIQMQ